MIKTGCKERRLSVFSNVLLVHDPERKQTETRQPKPLATPLSIQTSFNSCDHTQQDKTLFFLTFHSCARYIFYIGSLSEITLNFSLFYIGHKGSIGHT